MSRCLEKMFGLVLQLASRLLAKLPLVTIFQELKNHCQTLEKSSWSSRMEIEIKQEHLSVALKKQIDKGFTAHSIAATGHDEKFDPLAFIANEKGNFAGAIVVQLFWGALHLKYVYVEDAYRGRGVATRLMEEALNYGREHKCSFAFVETMSFQALEFYQKMGFELEFTRSGYKHGTSFHYLRKDFKEGG